MTTNLFTQNNKNVGDVIVTNEASSTGIQFTRTFGALPPAMAVSLFMANTSGQKGSGEEIFQIDVQVNFACTMASTTFDPAAFSLVQVFIDNVPFSVVTFLAGLVPVSPRATITLVFQNIAVDIDAAFNGTMNLTIP
jgi:hypothetical protein